MRTGTQLASNGDFVEVADGLRDLEAADRAARIRSAEQIAGIADGVHR